VRAPSVEENGRSDIASESAGKIDVSDRDRPKLSVVIATRGGFPAVQRTLEVLLPEISAVRGEVIVASGDGEPPPLIPGVTWIVRRDDNVLRLRRLAIAAARGSVIAMGEDHAEPMPGWCAAVVRAHAEAPQAAAVAGCLVNATSSTVAGRANFLGFAAPFAPPMPVLPSRPPPISALSFKRDALARTTDGPGGIESELVPRLFAENAIVVDDRIIVRHYQDNGLLWSIKNAYFNTRANYGYAEHGRGRQRTREVTSWIVAVMVRRQWREALSARHLVENPFDWVAVAVICASTCLGAVVGTLFGPGNAADVVA